MQTFFFDTNILVYYLRQDVRWQYIDAQFNLSRSAECIVSVVSWGELYALGRRNHWGEQRMALIDDLAQYFIIANIFDETVIRAYGEIDAFSQGRLPDKPLPVGFASARNMGKNDLWIAATAHVLGIPVLTTDNDFEHLQNTYIKLHKIVFPK